MELPEAALPNSNPEGNSGARDSKRLRIPPVPRATRENPGLGGGGGDSMGGRPGDVPVDVENVR
jgi:hypothetical protein